MSTDSHMEQLASPLEENMKGETAATTHAQEPASIYTPQAMLALVLAIRPKVHPYLDDKAAFTIPLCSKSIAPLVAGYVCNLLVLLQLLPDGTQRLSDFGKLINKLGMVMTAMYIHGNGPIAAGVLLASLRSMTFGGKFNHPLAIGVLPASLHSLTFGYFNQRLAAGVLPPSLRSLTFGYAFNQPLAIGVLPATLHSLAFGYEFNQPLQAGVLPASLHSLVLGDSRDSRFDKPLQADVLPPALQRLEIHCSYRRELVLPPLLQRVEPRSCKTCNRALNIWCVDAHAKCTSIFHKEEILTSRQSRPVNDAADDDE